MADGWIRIFTAPDPVVGGMAEELLRDAGIPVMLRSDDFLGIGGHACHPEILCAPDDADQARELLQEKGFLGGKLCLADLLERERDGIIRETVHHVRRLVSGYQRIGEAELRQGTEGAFDAARELILHDDFRRITLFLDSLLRQRSADGISSGDVVRAVSIFKDVLVGRILFLEDCSQEETNRTLERLEQLRAAIEERLATLGQRQGPGDVQALQVAALEILPQPLLIFRDGDGMIVWQNQAMQARSGELAGRDVSGWLADLLPAGELEAIEADILTRGESAPRSLQGGGTLEVLRLPLEAGDHHWSLLFIAEAKNGGA